MSQKTVTINGTLYDAYTGLPLERAAKTSVHVSFEPKIVTSSRSVHTSTQKSTTLNRSIVKKSPSRRIDGISRQRPRVTKSPLVTRFAPHQADTQSTHTPTTDIAPTQHPLQRKVNDTQAASKQVIATATSKPSHVIKNEAIAQAMKHTPNKTGSARNKQPKRHSRLFSLASAGLALLLLGGYFTYINMPNLSVRVASSQAGIAASYPEYRPDGYSLNGAVAYVQGEVSMKFAANSGSSNFTIRQSKSNWDSSAVLDNYVKQNAGDSYITYNERGLTIFTYGSNAAWVNRGILYTINGNAPLSTEQIRHIATSL